MPSWGHRLPKVWGNVLHRRLNNVAGRAQTLDMCNTNGVQAIGNILATTRAHTHTRIRTDKYLYRPEAHSPLPMRVCMCACVRNRLQLLECANNLKRMCSNVHTQKLLPFHHSPMQPNKVSNPTTMGHIATATGQKYIQQSPEMARGSEFFRFSQQFKLSRIIENWEFLSIGSNFFSIDCDFRFRGVRINKTRLYMYIYQKSAWFHSQLMSN